MKKVDAVAFGKELKILREHKKYNMQSLSEDIGKSISYVYQIEQGKVQKIPEENARQLLRKLGLTEDDIDSVIRKHEINSKSHIKGKICVDKCFKFKFSAKNSKLEVNACGIDRESALKKALEVFYSKSKDKDWISIDCQELAEEIYI